MGRFNPEIKSTSLDEVGVCAMTAIDEISLKNPDALLNGEALISIIQSCVPAISDARKLSNIDAEALFMAIQYASYGSDITHPHKCKKCEEVSEYSIDINYVLNKFPDVGAVDPIEWNDLKIYVRPASIDSLTRLAIMEIEQKRVVATVQSVSENEKDESRIVNTLYSSFRKIAEMNVDLLVNTIRCIETKDGDTIDDVEYIRDFMHNIPSQIVDLIQKTSSEVAKKPDDLTKFEFVCPECEHEDTVVLEVNPVNFFASGSNTPHKKK